MTWARMPWRVPFKDERCLPSGVRGPVDFCAFSRFARRHASETGRLDGSPFASSVVEFLGFAPITAASPLVPSVLLSLFLWSRSSELFFSDILIISSAFKWKWMHGGMGASWLYIARTAESG